MFSCNCDKNKKYVFQNTYYLTYLTYHGRPDGGAHCLPNLPITHISNCYSFLVLSLISGQEDKERVGKEVDDVGWNLSAEKERTNQTPVPGRLAADNPGIALST